VRASVGHAARTASATWGGGAVTALAVVDLPELTAWTVHKVPPRLMRDDDYMEPLPVAQALSCIITSSVGSVTVWALPHIPFSV
jgi:hypothetical protein